MQVNKLKLQNFCNIENLELEADSQMNVIYGENAQGKTNLLEAIWLFTGAKSFRGSRDSDFIKFGQASARAEIEFCAEGVKNDAALEFKESKKAFLNQKPLSSPAKLAGSFNAVIFSPNDLSIIKDGPDKRRRFLDTAIGQLYPNYIEILKNYTRAVKQRNRIISDLKYDGSVSVMLDVFEREIASSGEKIISYRKNYLDTLFKFMPDIYSGISGGREEIMSVYVANSCDSILTEELRKARKRDMLSGVTSVGPHRDDIEFLISKIPARAYGSQGQKRSVALALKFAQAEVAREISGEYPVCLLDDVMSELDKTRQEYILNHIRAWQTFISCCDTENTRGLSGGKLIKLQNGRIL